jgi:hypothetical protein
VSLMIRPSLQVLQSRYCVRSFRVARGRYGLVNGSQHFELRTHALCEAEDMTVAVLQNRGASSVASGLTPECPSWLPPSGRLVACS